MNAMKIMLWSKYGSADLLKLTDVEKPIPKADEIQIKIHSATVTAGDCELRRFDIHPLFWLPLRIILGIVKTKSIDIRPGIFWGNYRDWQRGEELQSW